MSKLLTNKKGETYIDVAITVMIVAFVLVFAVNVVSLVALNQNIKTAADQLTDYAAILPHKMYMLLSLNSDIQLYPRSTARWITSVRHISSFRIPVRIKMRESISSPYMFRTAIISCRLQQHRYGLLQELFPQHAIPTR